MPCSFVKHINQQTKTMARTIQRTISKETRTWVFYYTIARNAERYVIGTKDCKQPERTNLCKEQKGYWKRPDVVGTGYTTDLNDPFLVWPQSKVPMTNEMLDVMNRIMEEDEAEDMEIYG